MKHRLLMAIFVLVLMSVIGVMEVAAQGPQPGRAPRAALGTAFTYQGQLKNGGTPVNGTCTVAFRLYDDPNVGNQIGTAITQTIPITNGLFTTQLNASNEFGATAFNGDARWIEIRVSNTCPSSGTFTTLTPRQALTPAPYALYSSGNWGLSGNVSTSPTSNFIGTKDNQPLVFKTNNAEAMRVETDGNIGIGVTNPSQLLHLNVLPGHGEGMKIESSIVGHTPAIYLNHTGNLGHNFRIASYGDNTTAGSFRIRDDTAGADRLIINDTGTVNPQGNLVVNDNTGLGTSITLTRRLEVNGVVGVLNSNTRTLNAGIATEDATRLIDIGINDGSVNRFGGTYTSTLQGGFLRIESRPFTPLFGFFGRSEGTSGDATRLGYIDSNGSVRFEVGTGQKFSLGGSGTFEIDSFGLLGGRFVVKDDGKVGIGVLSPTYRLQLPNTADVMGQGQANAWQTYSSRRYKSNITTIENALDKVEHLRGVTFDWKQNGKHDLGLIAEEVGQVIPEIVSYEANGVDAQSLDYSRLVAVLIEATKEQQQQIELQRDQIATLQRAQDSQLAALKQQNAALEARLSTLEQKATTQSTLASAVSLDIVGPLLNGNLLGVLVLLVGVVMFYQRRK